MKKNQDKQIEGIIYKGCFCPFWGGMNVNKSLAFARDGLCDISVTILANNNGAAVVEVYEEDTK